MTMNIAHHCCPIKITTKFKEMTMTMSYAFDHCLSRGNTQGEKKNIAPSTPWCNNTIINLKTWKCFLLTFKVLVFAWIQGHCFYTFHKLLASPRSWKFLLQAESYGNSKPCELNPNASSNCPYFLSIGYGGEWKRREWGKEK